MRCFREEGDFLLYLTLLRAFTRRHDVAMHAYCLMPNHVHLLVTPSYEGACAALMKETSQRFARYFNDKYSRTGTLWEGRFRSCLAQSARYVLACYRYIELNPVRAGLAAHPGLYPWSSYGTNIGAVQEPLIQAHAEYLALASELRPRQLVYRQLVDDGMEKPLADAIRLATRGGYPLGSEQFTSAIQTPPGRKLCRGQAGRPPAEKDRQNKSVPDPDLFSS